jgi:hypothetical protein
MARSEEHELNTCEALMLKKLVSLLIAILKRADRSECDVVTRYQGQRWCDSSERRLNDELAMIRFR